MEVWKEPIKEQVEQAVELLLSSRKETFKNGIMEMMCPNDCHVSLDENTGSFWFTMTESMTNPIGIVHGGVIVTIFDTCGGMLSRLLAGISNITTTDIQTSFLKPVQIGDCVEVKVKLTSRGKSILHMTAEMLLPNGSIGATASMTYYVFKKPLDKRQLKEEKE